MNFLLKKKRKISQKDEFLKEELSEKLFTQKLKISFEDIKKEQFSKIAKGKIKERNNIIKETHKNLIIEENDNLDEISLILKNFLNKNPEKSQENLFIEKNLMEKKNFEIIKNNREKSLKYVLEKVESKKKTFGKFAFKTFEIGENNLFKKLFLQNLCEREVKGTMNIVDLWSEKNIVSYLGKCNLIKDKIVISKILSLYSKKNKMKNIRKFKIVTKKHTGEIIKSPLFNKKNLSEEKIKENE